MPTSKKGGFRPGSGRKRGSPKKEAVTIYLDASDVDKILSANLPAKNSLSSRCRELIAIGMESMKSSESQDTDIRFIDLFCGMGGIRIGFEQAASEIGLTTNCVFSSDIKPAAVKTYEKNFNENPLCDITKVDPVDIPDFDFLLGGFPCQAFSQAGLGLGFQDTRGTLFFDVAKILKEKQPQGFLLENVEGLYNHDGGKTFTVIKNTLIELGYTIQYKVLNGADFGLAQSRKRIYIIGLKNSPAPSLENFETKKSVLNDIIDVTQPPRETDFTKKLLEHFSIEDTYGKSIKDKRGGNNNIHSWDIGLKGEITESQKYLLTALLKQRRNKKWAEEIGIKWMDGMPLTAEMISTFYPHSELSSLLDDLVDKGYLVFEHPKQLVSGRRVSDPSLPKGYNIVAGKLSFEYSKILSPYEVTPTVVATDVHKMAVPTNGGFRPLTIQEGIRLFGFPEDYKLSHLKESEAFDLLGNTVCVPVIKEISKLLLTAANN